MSSDGFNKKESVITQPNGDPNSSNTENNPKQVTLPAKQTQKRDLLRMYRSPELPKVKRTETPPQPSAPPVNAVEKPAPSAPPAGAEPVPITFNEKGNPQVNETRLKEGSQPPEKSEPSIFSRLLQSGSAAIASAAAQDGGGIAIWNFFNALAFLILITLICIGIMYALSGTASIAQIKANWDKHRCDPSVMPFAALYGHNTSDNFNYCLGNIFDTKSLDITGPFSTVLGSFTSLLSMMMKSINSLRVGVATIGGGINVMFQDFTDRITTFFFQLRLSAIRIKALIGRMYAIMFAVMYMGLSGITGMTSFSNTVLFKFLDTFCFTPDTEVEIIRKGKDKSEIVPILDVQIGDILLPTKSIITSKFHFAANGQPMVTLYDKKIDKYVHVSSNHYLAYNGNWIRADEHPDALTSPQPFNGNSLICLNTTNHIIPIGNYEFRDYDETEDNNVDEKTMRFIEKTINGEKVTKEQPTSSYPFREYYPAIHPTTKILLADGTAQSIGEIMLGTKLSTGCTVIGKVHREIREYCLMPHGVSSSTLVWNKKDHNWKRAATMSTLWTTKASPVVFTSLFVSPSSIIELADGTMIRDSMELCSPDAELYYAQQLKQLKT